MNVNHWQYIPFTKAAKLISDEGRRVKQRDYLPTGKVPVIDQGQEFIGGYVNDENMLFKGDLPVIIFGDHTRNIKFVTRPFAVGAEGVKILKPDPSYEPKFFYYFLHTLDVPSRGYSRHFQFLRKFDFPLAPLTEQKLIVAEIEKQFSRLDEAVAALKRIQANLKRYKASVLKAAVEGKLTEQWRKEHPDVEPASKLLKRILTERRKKWEEKYPGKKYKEPASPDMSNLPKLPKGWVWSNLDQLSWSVKDGPHYSPKYSETGIPFISGGNVRPEGIDFSTAKYISRELHAELSLRCKPEFGDLLYTKGGTTGIAKINTEKKEFNVWVHVAVLKLVDSIERFYLQHALNSIHCYRQSQKYTHGVGNQDLGLTRMVWITVPLPPVKEQRVIISETDRKLSIVREMEHEVEVNIKRADRLRQSILQYVFRGNLEKKKTKHEREDIL